jgi:23S rRNA (uracil1939-C5)-methyltransferase
VLQHLAPEAQVRAKEKVLLDNLERIGGVRPARVLEPVRGPVWGYRARARLGVKHVRKKGRVLVGFRERNKRYVADLDACPVLVPPVDRLLRPLAALIGALSLRERIPQVEVAAGEERVALVLRVLDPPTEADLEALRAFERAQGVDLWLQPKGTETAAPLSPGTPLPAYGLPEFGLRLEFFPTQFTQVNPTVNRAMVRQAVELLAPGPGDRVLDLFCGLGNFTLPLATRAGEVVGVEGEAGLVDRARANARANGISNARFAVADLAAPDPAAWGGGTFERVLLDPPRTGAREVLAAVAGTGAGRIVYVACSPATLARDAGILVREHGFRLEAAGVMDMFPHTAHVESMALFSRG